MRAYSIGPGKAILSVWVHELNDSSCDLPDYYRVEPKRCCVNNKTFNKWLNVNLCRHFPIMIWIEGGWVRFVYRQKPIKKQITFPKESDWHTNLVTHFHFKMYSYASKLPSNCMAQSLIWQKGSFNLMFYILGIACLLQGMDWYWLVEGEGERKKKERKNDNW